MIYLDASVVFSLHFRDQNTPEAMRLVGTAKAPLVISDLCETESVNAFALRVFRNEMSARNLEVAVRDLEADLRSGVMQSRPIPAAAFMRAKKMALTITTAIGVRGADLLHIAAALELGVTMFYTFDRKQHQAAQAAGLAVNPLSAV